MSKKQRRNHSAQDKIKILRFHLLERKPISELCQEHGLHPTLFYKWQKEFFENGAAAFDRQPHSRLVVEYQKQITALEAKLQRKAEVLSEVTEEMVRVKKELGGI
jgi:transposase-like protein